MAWRVFSRISRSGLGHRVIAASPRAHPFVNAFHAIREPNTSSTIKLVPLQSNWLLTESLLTNASFQRCGFSSSASPQPADKQTNQSAEHDKASPDTSEGGSGTGANNSGGDAAVNESKDSKSQSTRKRRNSTKRTAFSDSDEECDLSRDDLVKLLAENEGLLKSKDKEIESMKDKVLRSYAEMENVIDRTKRDAENSKKFAIQSFAKSLLDVADNLGRASSVVKESFSKIDESKDSAGAVPLLKTLLDGVEMTEKQLGEAFKKFGVEKFDPVNENFDPNRHNAVFQVPDATKPSGTVAIVLKSGYMLYDRVLRPAEVGVTQASDNETGQGAN